jgi:hypothetical protein
MRQLLALGMVLISLGLGSELSYGQRDPNARCLLECHGTSDFKREVAPGQFKSLYVRLRAVQNVSAQRQTLYRLSYGRDGHPPSEAP